MSITTQGIDARSYLSGWMQGLMGMYTKDMNAIPDEQWTKTFGGCTRPANEITADAFGLLVFCTRCMQGDVPQSYGDEMQAMATVMADKAAAGEQIKKICGDFCAALSSASDETLNAEVMPPWQMPTPLYSLCQMAVSHVWYHDGQLNYIQCLLGDDQVHWMHD
ncbi:MAG: hypothetical protein ACAH95_11875 [Fimbriimonas sp.]